jgi:hypothetical protein
MGLREIWWIGFACQAQDNFIRHWVCTLLIAFEDGIQMAGE